MIYVVCLFFNCDRWWMPGNFAINGSKALGGYYNLVVPGILRL